MEYIYLVELNADYKPDDSCGWFSTVAFASYPNWEDIHELCQRYGLLEHREGGYNYLLHFRIKDIQIFA